MGAVPWQVRGAQKSKALTARQPSLSISQWFSLFPAPQDVPAPRSHPGAGGQEGPVSTGGVGRSTGGASAPTSGPLTAGTSAIGLSATTAASDTGPSGRGASDGDEA